jgi:ABC-type transporter Mla subunit MlaD
MTLATSLATIVGLLSNFKAERAGAGLDDFIEWLRNKNESDVAGAIERNAALASQLNAVLAANHEDLVTRLSSLNDTLAVLAAGVNGFESLAEELRQTPMMSAQAIAILRQLVLSKAPHAMEHRRLSGTHFILMGVAGELQFDEPHFAEEDIDFLVANGLLRVDYGSSGSRKLAPTRAAHALIASHPLRDGGSSADASKT